MTDFGPTWNKRVRESAMAAQQIAEGSTWRKKNGDTRTYRVLAIHQTEMHVVGIAASFPRGMTLYYVRVLRERTPTSRQSTSSIRAERFLSEFRATPSQEPVADDTE